MRWIGLSTAVLLTALASNASAQVDTAWVRRYGGPHCWQNGEGVAVTCDGHDNAVVAGIIYASDLGTPQWVILKYSPEGDLLWQCVLDSCGDDSSPADIVVDQIGCIYAVGYIDSDPRVNRSNLDILALKLDPDGNVLWRSIFDDPFHRDDRGTCGALDDWGNLYVAGYGFGPTGSPGGPAYEHDDYLIVKYGPMGQLLWSRNYDGPGHGWEQTFAAALGHAGEFVVTGLSRGASSIDCATVAFGSSGDLLWQAREDNSGNFDISADLCVASDGGFAVGGLSRPTLDAGGMDWLITRYNSSGERQWQRLFGGALTEEYLSGVAFGPNDDLWIAGSSWGPYPYSEIFVSKLDSCGTVQWSNHFDGIPENDYEESYDLLVGVDGTAYISGITNSAPENWTIRRIALDGNVISQSSYGLGGPYKEYPGELCASPDGAVVCVGRGPIPSRDPDCDGAASQDILTIRYAAPLRTQLDILPISCPNIINTGGIDFDTRVIRPGAAAAKQPTVPVAILGTKTFDVSRVDPATILVAGLSPRSHRLLDVSRPVEARETPCECTALGADGSVDLVLYFDQAQLLAALGPITDGEVRTLALSGKTKTGVPLSGSDCVTIKEGAIRYSPLASAGERVETGFAAYPNPFNAATVVSFSLSSDSDVRLEVYDVLGRRIATLVNGFMPAGEHQVSWDAAGVASGVYFARLETSAGMMTRKMVLVR